MFQGETESGETIDVLVTMDDTPASGGDKGLFSRAAAPVVAAVPVAALHESFTTAIDGLKKIFSDLPSMNPDLPLQQVQLQFEITASGKIALVGTGAETAVKGAITLTFARPPGNAR
ncbi:hypothetical protein [Cryptosporangium sp. NPDC051539]|uniref:Pepco domain-containing protein n=1 Tax=Cryptosporangium sp. NPDC051539 TaxID=3363962 RepID=UPI0037B02591